MPSQHLRPSYGHPFNAEPACGALQHATGQPQTSPRGRISWLNVNFAIATQSPVLEDQTFSRASLTPRVSSSV
jgi:hypothetical protein